MPTSSPGSFAQVEAARGAQQRAVLGELGQRSAACAAGPRAERGLDGAQLPVVARGGEEQVRAAGLQHSVNSVASFVSLTPSREEHTVCVVPAAHAAAEDAGIEPRVLSKRSRQKTPGSRSPRRAEGCLRVGAVLKTPPFRGAGPRGPSRTKNSAAGVAGAQGQRAGRCARGVAGLTLRGWGRARGVPRAGSGATCSGP